MCWLCSLLILGGKNCAHGYAAKIVANGKVGPQFYWLETVLIQQLKLVPLHWNSKGILFSCWLCLSWFLVAEIAHMVVMQTLLWMAKLGPHFYWSETIDIWLLKLVPSRWNSKEVLFSCWLCLLWFLVTKIAQMVMLQIWLCMAK